MEYIELVIKIPESEIPKQQDIIEIPLHFIDGKVCEAGGYEFDVLPEGHGRLIDADKLDGIMYHKAFETDSDMQKWDSGCWIRYKMFENSMEEMQTIIEADKAESEPWEKWLYPERKMKNER